MKIKTRFAPSPTGYLHIGSARTALYSWLFARKYGGNFVLRIENTDLKRSTPIAIQAIIDSMNWLNIDWDEGPYFQTDRFDRYNTVINKLLSNGTAYKCYCSKERLKILRELQIAHGKKPKYDGRCRNNHKCYSDSESYVIRFRNPQKGLVIFNDLIRGTIKFNNQELDDLIIRRVDGSPTYNFCVVVDDFDMAITHVIRGEDHINNTPRQINILRAIGAQIPVYAHVSMILGNTGEKLSKRHGAIGVMQYRDDGFLPEAILNYLVRLGWSYGNQEIFSIDEMKKSFSFNTVSKSSSTFDIKKLLWLNQHYIKNLPAEYITKHLNWHIKQQGIDISNGPAIIDLVKLLNKRCNTLKEMVAKCHYFYKDFTEFNSDMANKYLCQKAIELLKTTRYKLATLTEWSPELIRIIIKQTTKELKLDMGKVCMPLRIAVTGGDDLAFLTLDATIHAVGQTRSLERIDMALAFIANRT